MSKPSKMDILMVVMELSKGNPGAVSAPMEIIQTQDPRYGVLIGLLNGHEELQGSPIYILWSDLAGRDATKALDILFSVPLNVLKKAMMAQDYSGRKLIAPYLDNAQEVPSVNG